MPVFTYNARNAQGRPQQGTQEAASASALVRELRQRGWLVLDVKPVSAASDVGSLLGKLSPAAWLPIRSLDIELSLQQMAVMLRSGLTLLTVLRSIAEFTDRRKLQHIWLQIAEQIQEGAAFAETLDRYRCFPRLVVQLARVGEQTGTLETVIARAAETMERRRLLRTQLLTALTYPFIVFIASIGTAVFMIVSVIPKLKVFLSSLGRKLPPITQALLDVSDAVQVYGPWVALGLVILTVVLILLYLWPSSRMVLDRGLLRMPLIGKLLRLAATVQYAHGMGVLLRSGITLVEALRTVETMQRNRWVGAKIGEARTAVLHGGNLAKTLEQGAVFMPMLPKMVAVGESTGTLDDIMEELARFHENQLQAAIRRLSVLIEPVIVACVGGIVGFVYISFFVALFAAAGGKQ